MFTRVHHCAVVLVVLTAVSAYAINFGDPLPGLTPSQLNDFTNGQMAFTKVDNPVDDGLGPIFNEAACATCHTGPAGTSADGAVGGTTERLETRFGRNNGGVFDPLASEGGSLLQDHGIGNAGQYLPNPNNPNPPADCFNYSYDPEVIPADANVVAQRRTTPLFGLGLVNALTDNDIITNLINEFFNNRFAPPGRISRVPNPETGQPDAIGKFGWKAQVPTLHVFSGDAYLNEMGVTNPFFPVENCRNAGADNCPTLFTACNPFPQLNDDGGDVNNFTNFMMFLAPPPRGQPTASVERGSLIFGLIGCTECHTPTFHTGPNPIAALSNQTFHPYSDFLLHDMGSRTSLGLGDGITQNQATGHLMRTAPLWGLRAQTALLHDGRANDPNQVTRIIQAIEAHELSQEANFSEFLFDFILSSSDRTDVLNFLLFI